MHVFGSDYGAVRQRTGIAGSRGAGQRIYHRSHRGECPGQWARRVESVLPIWQPLDAAKSKFEIENAPAAKKTCPQAACGLTEAPNYFPVAGLGGLEAGLNWPVARRMAISLSMKAAS